MGNAGLHTTVSKTEFKARALEIMRRAEETGELVIITDRGRPVLELRRHYGDEAAIRASLRGSVTYHGDIVAPLPKEDWGRLYLDGADEPVKPKQRRTRARSTK